MKKPPLQIAKWVVLGGVKGGFKYNMLLSLRGFL